MLRNRSPKTRSEFSLLVTLHNGVGLSEGACKIKVEDTRANWTYFVHTFNIEGQRWWTLRVNLKMKPTSVRP